MKLTFLKTVGKGLAKAGTVIGPIAATAAFGPAAGAIVNTAIGKIVEASTKPVPGPEKKQFVMESLESLAPQIEEMIAGAGHTVKDGDKFANGAEQMVEALLEMLKSTGAVPTAPKEETPVPQDTSVELSGFSPSMESMVLTKGFDKPVMVLVRPLHD